MKQNDRTINNYEQSQYSQNSSLMQKVISSNQQLLKSQSQLIKTLSSQLYEKQKQITNLNKKFNDMQSFLHISKQQKQMFQKFSKLQSSVLQLEQQLVQTKIQLAIKSSQVLEKQAQIKKLFEKIKSLEGQNSQLLSQNQQFQRMSTMSETDIEDRKSRNEFLQITKDNISPDFIKITPSNFNMLSLRYNQGDKLKDPNRQSIVKIWSKYVEQQIIQCKPYQSKLSFHINRTKIQKFIKSTSSLLKKVHGIPHDFRHKVWQFISQDRLSFSNAFYIQLLDRKNRGWVCDTIKKQIQKDIHRSFNGQGSKQKLNFIHELTIGKRKNSEIQNQSLNQSTKQSQTKSVQSNSDDGKSTNSNNFRISEDVTQVLELFHIYRPDIGYVQGMTYPVIILTLITGKISALRILCNLILTNQFFKKMITFEPTFINYFCRIFDQLLEIHFPKLHQLIIKEYKIKSQIFLVDWFFTFFSRGISPKTILRIWDLLLYQNAIAKNPQVILYRVSLSILQLLESILLHTNYEECIRSVRQYYKKIDEQQLINKLYVSIKDNSVQKTFDEKFQRIKSRLERKAFTNI